jgi:uncharacterized damage-inducible protein DinB
MKKQKGRPRDYQFLDFGKPLTNLVVVDLLGELRQRTENQIADLSIEQLYKPFSEQNLTIGWLFMHLTWAELAWLPKITGQEPTEVTKKLFFPGKIGISAKSEKVLVTATDLISLSREHFNGYVTPALLHKPVDFTEQKSTNPDLTAGQICAHLFWHWSYHSGQIGLLGLMGGQDYQWSFR